MPTSNDNWAWQCDRVIASDFAAGRQLLDELLGRMESLHWSRREMFGVQLSVDEALVNAIQHGNALDEGKHVRFSCQLSPRKVRVEIIDEGPGFDPDRLPDPTDASHLDCPCGRGVMLMRAFMNHVEFCDGGNHVVLEKERTGVPDDPGQRGAVAVVVRDGRLLVIRRARSVVAPLVYCFPGGGIKEGESEEEALVREFREEVGVALRPVRRLWRCVTPWKVELAWWLGEIEPNAVPVGNPQEVESIHWCTPAEMAALPDLLESNREFLEIVDRGEIVLVP